MQYRQWRYLAVIAITTMLLVACQHYPAGSITTGATATMAATPASHDIDGSIQSGGLTRTYHVHLPLSYNGAASLPVVFIFHGRLGTGEGMITLSHMNTTADQDNFIAVYPDGYERSWADGRGTTPADKQHIDDVGFISTLIDTMSNQYHGDPHRIYATGISNGGFFTQRLGCQLADKIAAIVPDAATLTTALAATCALSRPIPYLLIQGTDDPLVPFNGGSVSLDGSGTALSEADSVAKWASLDGCAGTPATTSVPDTAHDGTEVTLTRYPGCKQNVAVAVYVVQGGGHTWPSGQQYLPVSVVGRTTHQIDNSTIWNFLKGFALPG
jgi:polyhydroxybutyrate depolymerase